MNSSDLSYYGDTGAFDPLVACQPGHDPYSDVGWFGSSLVKKIGSAVKSTVKAVKYVGHAVSPLVDKALPGIQQGLKMLGPMGMAASGALGTMKAALDGKSLKEIGLAAVIGSAPVGIDRAIQAGVRIANGDNLMKIGLDELGSRFKLGSQALDGFNIAKKLLTKGNISKEVLAVARRNLLSEEQRRAFDTAVGGAAMAADKVGMPRVSTAFASSVKRMNKIAGTTGPRPINTLPAPTKRRPVSLVSAPVRLALKHIQQTGGSPAAISKIYGAPMNAMARARKFVPQPRWRPISEAAQAFVLRHATHAPLSALRAVSGRDTGALVEGGAVYVVEPGDNPSKIAKKLTGNAARYPELHKSNPNKKIATSGPFKGSFAQLFAGERLIVPTSWRAAPQPGPVVQTFPVLVTGSAPSPVAVDSSNVATSAILQAKALLITWSKTDGLGQAGPSDYGVRPEDMSTAFGPRDTMVAMAFESWSNRTRGTRLTADGVMNAELSDALRAWAEARSSLPVPAVSVPSAPVLVPSVPAASPAAPVTPSAPVLPFPSLPPLVASGGGDKAPPVLPFPVLAVPPLLPAAGSSPATAAPASTGKSDSDVFMPIAVGAAGGLLFGPIGALIGAGLGVAASQTA